MASGSNGTPENTKTSTDPVHGKQPVLEKMEDKSKTPRHPRWTRQETLVLIEGKRIAEERGRKGRRSSSAFGSETEPKWNFVSSHCRQNDVNRGPVQCRKRWSNLISDFKKVKAWECLNNEGGSYWTMRNDLRRERKLPSFFDREVYDIMDGKASSMEAYQLVLVTSADENNFNGVEGEEDDDVAEDDEDEHGSFSEFEQVPQDEIGKTPTETRAPKDGKRKAIPSPVPISEVRYKPFHQPYSDQGTENTEEGPHHGRSTEFQEPKRRQASDECQNTQVSSLLLKALEKNAAMFNEQVEAQKLHYQLEREHKKEQHDNLIKALTRVTDALEKIADKLTPNA